MMNKAAVTTLSLHPLIKKRWSPRAFSEKAVEREKLERILEAARWSASCFNEQPWRFVLGIKGQGETYQKIFDSLAEGNQIWCKSVSVLVLMCAKTAFSHNNKPNKWAHYDLGQAAAYISMQAMAEGLFVHQMAGFDSQKVKSAFNIPADFDPFTVIAIGYLGDAQALPENLRKSELGPRTRRPLQQLVFHETWGKSWLDEQ